MEVTVNGEKIKLRDSTATLADLLRQMGLDADASRQGLAIAVNNKVIPAQEWERLTLKDNDQVLIVRAVQGG